MTKKDYQLIATAIRLRKGWPIETMTPEQVRVSLAKSIAAELEADNARFIPAKFYAECGVDITPPA